MELLTRMRQALMAQSQHVQERVDRELIVGPGCLFDIAELLHDQDLRCVMVITSPGFVKRGIISSFTEDLIAHGIAVTVFSDVKPDPDIECVKQAAAFFRSHACEAMVAIGGGSVMDCAKAAGALIARPGKDVVDLMGTMKVRAPIPYLVAVPTTAGTGSEASAAAVITDPERRRKYSLADLFLIPDVAVLDPNLLLGLSPEMTAYTGMDALTHAVEAYINHYGSHAAHKNAKEAVSLVFEHLKASFDDGDNVLHREGMLVASYYAGLAFSSAMVGYVHALAHGIGGRYHVQHGLANAVLLPVVLREYGAAAESRLAKLAEVIGLEGADDRDLAQQFIAKIRELGDSVGIPETIPEIREGDIAELAAGACAEGNPAYPVPEIWDCARFETVLRAVAEKEQEALPEERANADSAAAKPVDNPQPRRVKRAAAAGVLGVAAAAAAVAVHVHRRGA